MFRAVTNDQFIIAFRDYNTFVFPFQIVIFLIGLMGVVLIHRRSYRKNSSISILLGSLWLWTGIFFHTLFLSELTSMGYFFGFLAAMQGFFFIYEALFRNKLEFSYKRKARYIIGYIMIAAGMIIYPLIGFINSGAADDVNSLGLPGPSTIFTFGFLLMTVKKMPLYLLIIPSLWALIGISFSLNTNSIAGILTLISAIIAVSWSLSRRKFNKVKKAPLE